MRKAVKFLSVLLTLCVIISSSVIGSSAVSYPNNVKTMSDSILLVNMDTGEPVYEKDADSKRYPASTTKIMTYIVVVENIDDLDNTRVSIKKSIIDQLKDTGSSLANVGDHVGETMSVIDLLYSMMVPSGNDAAMVLADYVGDGDILKFVQMMNDKAKELGCENTHFANPDGLHDEDHYTTARDLYKISTYALTLPRFSEISNTCEYTCEGDDQPLVTTNYLIDANRGGEYYYMYAKGIKTGTTDQAGRCLVTTASADGYSYIAILLHAPYKEGEQEEYYTFTDAADLFRWALTSLKLKTVKTSKTPICEQKIKLAWGKSSVNLVPEKDITVLVPSDINDENITIEPDLPEVAEAPLSTDKSVGTATVYYMDSDGNKQEVAKVNLVPEENVERSGILLVLDVIGTILQSYWFLVLIGIIIVILIIYFIYAKISKNRRKKRRNVKHYRNF